MIAALVLTVLAECHPLPSAINLVVGEQRCYHVAGIQRVAMSDSCYDIKTIGNDDALIEGANAGKSTLLIWLSNGKRRSVVVNVRAGRLPRTEKVNKSREPLPQLLADGGSRDGGEALHDVRPAGDGGTKPGPVRGNDRDRPRDAGR